VKVELTSGASFNTSVKWVSKGTGISFLLFQIFLDPKEKNNTEYKLATFTVVYRRLCGKDVAFEYPVSETA
jgi:hypothetical protein